MVVIMGVAGAGKTTVGRTLADTLHWPFYDADDFHSADNVARMRAGTPLTDADRAPWLEALNRRIADTLHAGSSAILACSALRRIYRAALVPVGATPDAVRFVHLRTAQDVLSRRLARRRAHYATVSLLPSQLATLEEPGEDERALILDGARSAPELVAEIMRSLGDPIPLPRATR